MPAGDRGLTLLELVVAVAVLSIGLMAALRATDQSRIALGQAAPRRIAELAAENRAEELRLYGPGRALPARVQLGGAEIVLETRTRTTAAGLVEATVTARHPDGVGAVLVAVLPGAGG